MTLHDQYLRAFQLAGWTIDTSTRVTRYTVLKHPNRTQRVFLGANGACRVGLNRTSSHPLSDLAKERLLDKTKAENIAAQELGL